MNNKVSITAKLPKSVHQKMLEKVIQDGYGMRGKSVWITEALESFLAIHNFPELVDIANDMEEKSGVVSLRIPETLDRRLEEALIQVRLKYPMMEGVKSNIIRASILQRLLRGLEKL